MQCQRDLGNRFLQKRIQPVLVQLVHDFGWQGET